ncbi:MAG: alpha/beta hydrolase [Gammaproteobacteria bacterium]
MKYEFGIVEILPPAKHRYTIIWLHGLGADGHDFEGIVPELRLGSQHGIRFVFPNAPVQPVTINGGMAMRAWYDIADMSFQGEADIAGIEQSSELISNLVRHETERGIPSENIMLAGFSQGGLIALHAGLRYSQRLAGIMALSCYLPTLAGLSTERAEANASTPIFMAHGSRDPVVPLSAGKAACDGLEAMRYPVDFRIYPMEHAVCLEEILDIAHFIDTCFGERVKSND